MSTETLPTAEEERVLDAAAWASRLADGGVAGRQDELEAWIGADTRNQAALEDVFGAWQSVETYAGSAEMVALREEALASARRTLQRRRGQGSPMLAWAVTAAVLLLAVLGGGLWAWHGPHDYSTGVGERRMVALSDGSKVTLDGDSLVKVDYTRDRRRLWLVRGRAKFEVAKNPLRPFFVVAADKVVVATGTAFSVELVRKQVRVVLYEGHVALLEAPKPHSIEPQTISIGPDRTPAEQLLKPGKEMILPEVANRQPALVRAPIVELAEPARSLAWEDGQMVFDDEPLGVVVDRMNRYAKKPLVITDPATANLKISGVFQAGDTDALVQGLAAAFDVQAQAGPDSVALARDPKAKAAL